MAALARVDGLDELRAALKAAGPAWEKDLARAHRKVSTVAVGHARRDAQSGTRQQARSAGSIRPSASKTAAKINVRNTASAPMALAAFWGMERRTGWYANPRYSRSVGRQAPRWVGASWRAGVAGQGPHVINDSLADHLPDVMAVYEKSIEHVVETLAARRVTSF